ncbi:hypothetical protein Golomagni_06086 [Golovinomyces magnicellulatus]|nr:hypothetical protein Golomagni_06086 [Golovinomyces magnicellulatus]
MPAPGDQHTAYANPFEEVKPKISEWTAKEIATISSRLDKQLGPEYISSRAGPGGSRVHYLTAEKVIGLANEVFGFNGWSSSIQNIQVDFADENQQTQRVSVGLSVIVRITLRDGTFHEDIGYGSIENARGKAMAFEKAKKEGTTDALKRTLRSFGNVLGNCIYDQGYVKQVTKIKAQPVKKFDQDNLHRHSDFVRHNAGATTTAAATAANNSNKAMQAPPAPAAAAGSKPTMDVSESFEEDFLGDFDEADFNVPGDGHPDEVMLPTANGPTTNATTMAAAAVRGPAGGQPPSRNGSVSGPRPPQTPNQGQAGRPGGAAMQPPAQQPNPGEPVAFFSARSAPMDPNQAGQTAAEAATNKKLFNPKAESPSIRKTPGIDHSSSKPLTRSGQHVPPASQSEQDGGTATGTTPAGPNVPGSQSRGNVLNPSLDQVRRIGAPGGAGSPLSNRGQYKPPTMKRPLGGDANGNGGPRVPLSDVPTNGAVAAATGDGVDSKRQKTT